MSGGGSGPSGIEDGERQEKEEDRRKRDSEAHENRERKRSRFDDAKNHNSPTGAADMEETHSPSMNERPLFERLKTLAEGYQFGSSAGQDKNSLLGAPIGPPLRPGLPSPRGFPRGGGQFPGPRQPWLDNRDGQRPWFDSPQSQNPFINPNPGQNPFAQGNPFVQTANNSENPFEVAAVAGQRPEGFFGAHPRGRGGMRGSSRDGGNWHNRRMEEEMHGGADRGFRGRGRGDLDRGRRRDWGEREDGVRDGNRERERKLSRESENSAMNFSHSQPSTGLDENWEEQRNENATGNHANSEFGNNSINNPADEVWDEPESMSTSDAAHNDQPDYNEDSWVDNNAESSDAFKNSTNENWQEANHANHDNSPLTNDLASNNVNDICEGEFEERSMDSNIYENDDNGNDVTSDWAGCWNTGQFGSYSISNPPVEVEVRDNTSRRLIRDISDISSVSSFGSADLQGFLSSDHPERHIRPNELSSSDSVASIAEVELISHQAPHFDVEFEVASVNSFSSNPIEDANSSSGLEDEDLQTELQDAKQLTLDSSSSAVDNFADEEETEDSIRSDKGPGALSDSELSEKDLWFCTQCHAKTNNPYLRYCLRCFRIRRDWLPKRPRPKKTRKRRPTKTDSRNKRHTSSEEEDEKTIAEQTEVEVKLVDVENDGPSTAPNSTTNSAVTSTGTTTPSPGRDIDVVDSGTRKTDPSAVVGSDKSSTLQIFKNILTSEPVKIRSLRNVEETEIPVCSICLIRDKDSCFVHGKTAHMYSCYSCADKILKKNGKCPICRKRILRVVKVITS